MRGLAEGRVAPAYLVMGADEAAHAEVLAALRGTLPAGAEHLCYEELPPDASAGQVAAAAMSVPLLGRRVLVLREGALVGLRADTLQPLLAYLRSPSPATVLALTSAEELADGHPLVRAVAAVGVVVRAAPPRRADVLAWLRREAAEHGLELGPGVAELLLERCGRDRRSLRQELAKMAAGLAVAVGGEAPEGAGPGAAGGAGPLRVVSREEAARLVPGGWQETAFELVEGIFAGRIREVLGRVESLLRQGEEVPALIGLLARQVRLLWQARALGERGRTAVEAASALGVRSFQAERLLRQARRVGYEELAAALVSLLAADLDVKRGALSPQAALEGVCLRLAGTWLSPGRPRPRATGGRR